MEPPSLRVLLALHGEHPGAPIVPPPGDGEPDDSDHGITGADLET